MIEATSPPTLKRQYPHVDDVRDWRAQQTIRLLWDRVFDLEARLQASESSIDTLVDSANDHDDRIDSATRDAREALAVVQQHETTTEVPGSEGEGDTLPGGGDGGAGNAGCGAAGATGHIGGSGLTENRVGQICCGTANEFPSLTAATATEEERLGNAEELIRRMIWHLQQHGFTAGRQRNPSGLLSRDKLAVVVDSGIADPTTYTRAYDVIHDLEAFEDPMDLHMNETDGANLVTDAGVAD